MAEYSRAEAREWARQTMRGVCGCLLPTLNNSLTGVNEAAIRHDLRLERANGFWGALLVSECGTTLEEMRDVINISVDEARRQGLRTMLLASFPDLDDTIGMVRYAESAGVDLVLMSYPIMFYPSSEQEVLDYTKAVADSTDLGVMLFCMPKWGFGRFHPSGFSPDLIGRMIDEIDNIVAVKNEIGHPGVAGIAEVFKRYGDRVVVSDPLEQNAPAWCSTFGMPFMATSNYEYFGSAVPRYFQLLQEDKYDEAMEIYWRIHPARRARAQTGSESGAGTGLVHRQLWKYQYWLSGYNGGPVRQPAPRINQAQMGLLRSALEESGITPTDDDDAAYFVGRNPTD